MDNELYNLVLKELENLKKEILELKDLVKTNSKSSISKITVIGNRPQKKTKITGLPSNDDAFEL